MAHRTPVCGAAENIDHSSVPSTNLCQAGTASSVSQQNNNWWNNSYDRERTCSNALTSVSCSAERTCGNSLLDSPDEECDDGNYVDGDGCDSLCKHESYSCQNNNLVFYAPFQGSPVDKIGWSSVVQNTAVFSSSSTQSRWKGHYVFDGSNSLTYWDVFSHQQSDRSLSLWLRPEQYNVSFYEEWSAVSLGLNSAGRLLYSADNSLDTPISDSVVSSSSLSLNVWSHVVVTFSFGSDTRWILSFYVDGSLAWTGEIHQSSLAWTAQTVFWAWFDGWIDEITFWSIPLGVVAVQELYNSWIPQDPCVYDCWWTLSIGDLCDDGLPHTSNDAIVNDCWCHGETWCFYPYETDDSACKWNCSVDGTTLCDTDVDCSSVEWECSHDQSFCNPSLAQECPSVQWTCDWSSPALSCTKDDVSNCLLETNQWVCSHDWSISCDPEGTNQCPFVLWVCSSSPGEWCVLWDPLSCPRDSWWTPVYDDCVEAVWYSSCEYTTTLVNCTETTVYVDCDPVVNPWSCQHLPDDTINEVCPSLDLKWSPWWFEWSAPCADCVSVCPWWSFQKTNEQVDDVIYYSVSWSIPPGVENLSFQDVLSWASIDASSVQIETSNPALVYNWLSITTSDILFGLENASPASWLSFSLFYEAEINYPLDWDICNQAFLYDIDGVETSVWSAFPRWVSDDPSVAWQANPTCLEPKHVCWSLSSPQWWWLTIWSWSVSDAMENTYTCSTENNFIVNEIVLDCWNGQTWTWSATDVLTRTCVYDAAWSYDVSCRFKWESLAHEDCRNTFVIEVLPETSLWVCWDGYRQQREDCDFWDYPDGSDLSVTNGRLYLHHPTPYLSDDRDLYTCSRCQLYGPWDPGPWEPPESKTCRILFSDWSCLTDQPACFAAVANVSVMKEEIIPFWWDMQEIENEIIPFPWVAWCSPWDENKIIDGSIRCDFSLINGPYGDPGRVRGSFVRDCLANNRWSYQMFAPFESKFGEDMFSDYGRTFVQSWEIADVHGASSPIGEYHARMDRLSFMYCSDDGTIKLSETDFACQTNFTLTSAYLAQRWMLTDDTAVSLDLNSVKWVDGSSLFEDNPLIQSHQAVENEWVGETDSLATLDGVLTKYKQLAKIPATLFNDNTNVDIFKVPNKDIYVSYGDLDISDPDFDILDVNADGNGITLIVADGDLRIRDNVKTDSLFVVPDWNIEIVSDVTCADRQFIDGIYIAGQGFVSNVTEDVRNNSLSKDRCFEWWLTIKGSLIGWNVDALVGPRRSHLNDWFLLSEEDKALALYGGAALLIENNADIRVDPPDGFSDIYGVLWVQKN